MPDITYDVGRVSFIMKGAWNLATSYEKLDAVSYNGSLYIAKQDVPGGTAITNTTYWQLAAEKGDKGDTGGVDSVNGQQGDVWFPDSRQLISDGYTTDTEPFLTRDNDSDSDRFELAKKLGNTVTVNQLQRTQTTAETATYSGVTVSNSANGVHLSGTATADIGNVYFDRTGYSETTIPGHTYLLFGCPSGDNGNYYLEPLMGAGADWCKGFPRDTGSGVIFTATKTNDTPDYIFGIRLYIVNGATNLNVDINCYLIDLTRWFGNNDRIPLGLLAHPENRGDYYDGPLDYEPGRLESADGTYILSKDAYSEIIESVDTGSEVLHGDGTPEHSDSKLPDGTILRKRITYTITGNENVIAWYDNTSAVYAHHYGGAIQIPNLGIAYGADTYGNASNGYLIEYANNNKAIYASLPTRLDILDDSYTTQAAWLAGITGTVLILDVVTPTTEQGTAFEPLVATVKGGVLSWTNTKGIPVGQESHWFENLRKRVEDRLPDPPSADGTYRLTCTITGGVKTYSWEA